MKIHGLRPFLFLLFLFVPIWAQAPSSVPSRPSFLDHRIDKFEEQDANIHLVLSNLANQFDVPVGFELADADNLLDEKRNISVDFRGITIESALNEIVHKNPLYVWSVVDNAINVLPKDRPSVLEDILSTTIQYLRLKDGVAITGFRDALIDSSEFGPILGKGQVEFTKEGSLNLRPLKITQGAELGFAGGSCRKILNGLITQTNLRYWIVGRVGKHDEYVLINF